MSDARDDEDLDERLKAMRQKILADLDAHCAEAAASVGSGRSAALLRTRKQRAAIEADIDRYEAALRQRRRS